MKDRIVRGLLIDVDSKEPKVIEIADDIYAFYEYLHCDCIDIVTRVIGNDETGKKAFTVVVDDEGLFVEKPKPSAIDDNCKVMFVGNIFICNSEETTDGVFESSLSDSDIELLIKNVTHAHEIGTRKTHAVIRNCNYNY